MSSMDVIVPCYLYGMYLQNCVESVLSQGIPDLRVLIIDDESPDDTPEIGQALARQYPQVSYRRHAVNRGHIATYNEGIEWAKADYTLLLSADDYLLPGALKRGMDLMDTHTEVGLCFGSALELRSDGSRRPLKVKIDAGSEPYVVITGTNFVRLCIRLGSNNPVYTPTAIVRTSLLQRVGGYRADLAHSGDLEMWLRLAALASVGIVKAEQAVYRRHTENMSNVYFQDHSLQDLEQRKAAFDAFLQNGRDTLPGAENLYRSLLTRLGEDAVSYASSAFNNNRADLSDRLCRFAQSVSPDVRRSWPWNRLALKRLVGFRISSTLLPAVNRIRATAARICG